jgi:mannose-6-phosphate isomerase-like protein (cupin superfamily)
MTGHNMPPGPMIISAQPGGDERAVRGSRLAIVDAPAEGLASEVAPLHVHHADDEAWHVIAGALRFRFAGEEFIAGAGSTVLVPAGVAHTFGNAGPDPSRYIIILPARLDEMISLLHETDRAEHAAIYRRYESELLE